VRFDMVMGASQPVARSSFSFPVAFAVMRRAASGASGWRLRYLRVAEHLQRMGIGWRVTRKLLESYPDTELDMATRAPELRSAAADADRARYSRLFRAAKRISSRVQPQTSAPVSRAPGTPP
jgi:hypothetical protein